MALNVVCGYPRHLAKLYAKPCLLLVLMIKALVSDNVKVLWEFEGSQLAKSTRPVHLEATTISSSDYL